MQATKDRDGHDHVGLLARPIGLGVPRGMACWTISTASFHARTQRASRTNRAIPRGDTGARDLPAQDDELLSPFIFILSVLALLSDIWKRSTQLRHDQSLRMRVVASTGG